MKDDSVPDKYHISRYCGGSHIENGGISGTAFRLRERNGKQEKYLSVNWLECLKKESRKAEIQEIQIILNRKLQRVGSKAKIAVLNVGELREYVSNNSEDGRDLHVLHKPEPDDPLHSGIHNLRPDDDLIADLIAQIVQETHPAK